MMSVPIHYLRYSGSNISNPSLFQSWGLSYTIRMMLRHYLTVPPIIESMYYTGTGVLSRSEDLP